MVDELKQRLGSGVVVLGSRAGGKAALAMGVTKDLSERLPAGDLIKRIAPAVGGTGGGRADFAQAGGSNPDGISDAFDALAALLGGEDA